MATVVLTSAAGVLSLLDEPETELKVHALRQLNQMVDHFWVEIATSIPKIEVLYESDDFKERQLAAAVASKVFYHLEEFDDALKYALGAGEMFNVGEKSEYVETLIAKCIDQYVSLRVKGYEGKTEEKIDPRLEEVVERMFERCFADGEFKQAVGVALEARRLDVIKQAVQKSDEKDEMLSYLFHLTQSVVGSRHFRQEVLRVLVDLYRTLEVPDYISMCQCLLFLSDPNSVAAILDTLIKEPRAESALMAYQVAFDLNENQNHSFLMKVSEQLPKLEGEAATATPVSSTDKKPKDTAPEPDTYETRMGKLKSILNGDVSTSLYLHFLYGQNKTDLNVLQNIKDKLEPRNSVTHNATVMAHAMMHAGTTVDTFLREDIEWLGKATNWAKFTATASIGVIHRGHHKESLKLLETYLPQAGQPGSPFQEGGALYALGLVHANHTGDKTPYLLEALRNAGTNEIVQHGACLGIGLTAMATADDSIYEILKAVVFTDNAVAGEAAGLAMGLVLLGTGHGEALQEMLSYAQDTKHEKIIRGLALGMALVMYGREEAADVLIQQLLRDKDPILRFGGVNAIAMAYVGTANNAAVKRLLHLAVSDVSNDVRRAAVTGIGFVLCNEPEQVPRIVSLLSESYNAHVRYGACLAVGIACAGSGLKDALDLLEPLMKDKTDFVRQAAYIGIAMVLIQHNKVKEPRVENVRKVLADALSIKGDTMTKFGAILAAGILDAGGRNVTISLLSPAGHRKMAAIAGMLIFPQFWYWYPLVHFISLAFTPTAVIGLNKNIAIPEDWTFTSAAPPSLYAYPAIVEVKKEEKRKKVPTATLSVTAKAKAKLRKKREEDGSSMEVEEETEEDKKEEGKDDAKEGEEKKEGEVKPEGEEKKAEPTEEVLRNPCRVTWEQQKVLRADPNQRYQSIKKSIAGIVMLRDSTPDQEEHIFQPKAPKIGVPGVSDDEPAPPEPFEFMR